MKKKQVLYILCNGRVAAIDKKDGTIIWEVKLKQYLSRGVTMSFGQINVEDDKIYIGASGVILCLSTKDGSLVWTNELKGWGYSYVSLANTNSDSAVAASASAAASAAIVAAT